MTGDAVDAARRVAFGLEQVQDHLRSLYTLANQRLSLLAQQAELPGLSTTVSPRMIDDAREEAVRLQAGVAEAETVLGRASAATATARAGLDSLDEEISEQSALVSQHDLEHGQSGQRRPGLGICEQFEHGGYLGSLRAGNRPTSTKYTAIRHNAAVTQGCGASPCTSASAASADHASSAAVLSQRSRRTRTGWMNLIGTKVNTAKIAIATTHIHAAGFTSST